MIHDHLRRDTSLADRLRSIVGTANVLSSPSDLLVYECDGFTIEKNKPDVVVFPTSTEQIVAIVQVCRELKVPFVAAWGRHQVWRVGAFPAGGGVIDCLDADEANP